MGKVKETIKNYNEGIITRLYHELKWIYSFYRNYLPRIIGYFIMVLLQTGLSFFISYKVGSFVDFALDKNLDRVIHLGILYVVLFSINAALSTISNRFSAWNYNDLQRYLVEKMFGKITTSDWETLSTHHSGDLLIRLSKDTKTVSGNANGFLTTVFSQLALIIGALTVIIYYDVTMLLVVAIAGPIILLSSRIFMNHIYENQAALRQVESKESSFQKETFHNIQAVKAFGLSDIFQGKIAGLEQERYNSDMQSNKYSILGWMVSYLSGILAAILCIGWAYYRVYTDAMTLGDLSVIIVFAVQIAYAGKTLIGLIPTALEVASSSERVREILEIPDEAEEKAQDFDAFEKKAKENGVSVKVEDMSFAYKNCPKVFDEVSLEANPGEIVALVGPSGEGKTTMLRILLGIIRAQEGKVYATTSEEDGENEMPFSTATRQLIAYVPQGNTMLSGTIAENMRLIAPEATDEEIIDALEQACAYDFVKKLPDGIYHNIGESGLGFSEGQNQRLAIARAVLRKTPILLMDEATSALDVATERKVLKNLMKKDGKRTCILTTHRPSVLSACNRVYRIADHKVTVIGDSEIQQLMNDF